MRAMETLQDLIDEAKVRTVWWGLVIFGAAYFLSHTSKSLWMNVPVAILVVSALRILTRELEFRWKPRSEKRGPRTYLSHLSKRQLALDDPRLSTAFPPMKWKRKIDSPVVEAAADEFISKILRDFVTDLWYSDITPDKEFPELIRFVIMEALGEISGRVKQLNLFDLLTRDIVDLVGNHIDLFRRNQAAIGVDVMGILSSEERDERLKHHLLASKELHPALISPECEYKVLQRLVEGVLAVVLGPREAQCRLVRCIAREIVTCLVLQPVMNFASPIFVNEVIELVILAVKDDWAKDTDDHDQESVARNYSSVSDPGSNVKLVKSSGEPVHSQSADWVRVMEAATQRRTEVLAPENLENMWARGRHYGSKVPKSSKTRIKKSMVSVADANYSTPTKRPVQESLAYRSESPKERVNQAAVRLPPQGSHRHSISDYDISGALTDPIDRKSTEVDYHQDGGSRNVNAAIVDSGRLKRSYSATSLQVSGGLVIHEDFYSSGSVGRGSACSTSSRSDTNVTPQKEEKHAPRLRCQVVGAHFEKIGSNSFAVYSIAVSDEENMTWNVKRRYRNFEHLHRQLKDIPNYTLHLPPKRIFSSSTEDAFVHQRCIHLNRYLQDLLSIANVAEHHEVWDFFSTSSKSYAFGKSSSVMKTLAVNVDGAVDDIVRQFKGVAGLTRKVVGSSPSPHEASPSTSARSTNYNSDESSKHVPRLDASGSASLSENEEEEKEGIPKHAEKDYAAQAGEWDPDNEPHSGSAPCQVGVQNEELEGPISKLKPGTDLRMEQAPPERLLSASSSLTGDHLEDPVGMPLEWTPPNVSVPVLNLVDKIFQLKRRGWVRRQVFWISKQILQLMMEDAIDDWLLRQVHWLRREDVVAQGVRWIQDILWPGGTFFRQAATTQSEVGDGTSKTSETGSFKQHLEETRRANEVKKMLLERAPTTLVSLIGQKQYKRCAKDIYYFSQSTICVKQLAYGALELLIISVFPELREVVIDIHRQMRGKPIV
uniref:Uncharacterized protein n=1 Tax=Kalanchoe fedtschenkoi TaxID=63787 RepID=A0A7N0T3S2_KALFE